MNLLPFQKRFLAGALPPEVDTAFLPLPRGNGKSALAGWLLARILNPADALFRPKTESVLCAASIEQARIVFRFARAILEPTGAYRFLDSATRIGITHKATNTRLRVIGSNGKTAMGLVDCPWAVCDEPGAWEVNGGTLLFDAIQTAQGKPESRLKSLYIGTIAPSMGGWWKQMVEGGCTGSTFGVLLQGDADAWDSPATIRRCNPLMWRFAESRKKLFEERDAARVDTRLRARFLSYRLNVPSGDEAQMLLTLPEWKLALDRDVADRQGKPIVGIDLGGGRAWSAAVAFWRTGRTEAVALAPGIPSLEAQEKRDSVPLGAYAGLRGRGRLLVADGLRVPETRQLVDFVKSRWGVPQFILCDRFRVNSLRDTSPGCPIVARVGQWSESTADINAVRKLVADGPLSVEETSRALLSVSLSAAMVKHDGSGNIRMVKRGQNNQARDDVAAAMVVMGSQMLALANKPPADGPGFNVY